MVIQRCYMRSSTTSDIRHDMPGEDATKMRCSVRKMRCDTREMKYDVWTADLSLCTHNEATVEMRCADCSLPLAGETTCDDATRDVLRSIRDV